MPEILNGHQDTGQVLFWQIYRESFVFRKILIGKVLALFLVVVIYLDSNIFSVGRLVWLQLAELFFLMQISEKV